MRNCSTSGRLVRQSLSQRIIQLTLTRDERPQRGIHCGVRELSTVVLAAAERECSVAQFLVVAEGTKLSTFRQVSRSIASELVYISYPDFNFAHQESAKSLRLR